MIENFKGDKSCISAEMAGKVIQHFRLENIKRKVIAVIAPRMQMNGLAFIHMAAKCCGRIFPRKTKASGIKAKLCV